MSQQQQQQPQQPLTITKIIEPELPNLMAILSLNTDKDATDIQVRAFQELNYLEQHAVNKPVLLTCDQNSIILAVKNVLGKNLSLDPNAGLVYIKTRNLNVGTYQQPKWKTVLEIQETANGLLSYNRQIGRILDYTNPEVKEDADGKVVGVSMQLLKPSWPQPRWEKYSFTEGDFLRWRRASHKENKKGYKQDGNKPVPNDSDDSLNYANPNYYSWKKGPDPEFIRAKCIRHSLKKLGANPNEDIKLVPRNFAVPINNDAAIAEAEDSAEFTPHEEINTTINNEAPSTSFHGNGSPGNSGPQDDDFANNL